MGDCPVYCRAPRPGEDPRVRPHTGPVENSPDAVHGAAVILSPTGPVSTVPTSRLELCSSWNLWHQTCFNLHCRTN